MVRFDILTLFPNMFEATLGDSIIGRACKSGVLQINTVNIRDFTTDKHGRVDDYPYGGGRGMIMTAQPIYDAYKSVVGECGQSAGELVDEAAQAGCQGHLPARAEGNENSHECEPTGEKPLVVYMSPQGMVLTQKLALELASREHIIVICGHYEGVDERIIEEIVDLEISIGDYVLTGGEIPAMVLVDCVGRQVSGVLADEECVRFESHYDGLLEYPQYTRPHEFLGREVPEVLLSGNHAEIAKWRREQAVERTRRKRADLIGDTTFE